MELVVSNRFEMIAGVRYRDAVGGWWTVGKVGACIEDGHAVQASVYMHAFYLGRCFAFPFVPSVFPYLHGDLMGFDGHYEEEGVQKQRWTRCGFISSHEVDGSDWEGEKRIGSKMYRLHLDALPFRTNKKGTAIVLKVREA